MEQQSDRNTDALARFILSGIRLTRAACTTAGQRAGQRPCRLSYKAGLATIQKTGYSRSTTARICSHQNPKSEKGEKSEALKKTFLQPEPMQPKRKIERIEQPK